MHEFARFIRRRLARALYVLWRTATPKNPPGPDLTGDRDIEWSWVLAHLPNGAGKALDLGPGATPLLSVGALHKGFQVLALDIEKHNWQVASPELDFRQGNLLTETISPDAFELIICCSMIEHVGITGRYGDQEFVPEGDMQVMERVLRCTKRGGTMLLTIPVGLDAIFAPYHRVYGEQRLPRLLEGWVVKEEKYWLKDTDNRWISVMRAQALKNPGSERYYGIGCFVLKKTPA